MFQSSSSPKAGCNLQVPGLRQKPVNVSILIQPEGRMQLLTGAEGMGTLRQVSILIQPEGRMQQCAVGLEFPPTQRFQSSSSPKAGCNCPPSRAWTAPATCFNPHPARRPDATYLATQLHSYPTTVSILIQPEGRMQPVTMKASSTSKSRFQSSSSPKAGCNSPSVSPVRCDGLFQSSSSPKAGCNSPSVSPVRCDGLFQSSSSPKAGCNISANV